ncbi:DUF1194 domain-containing protein [Breoghania corrubedonensis]|nr:DUF1194 domain-containing protein [Breoghania corrubedonensis]
MRSARGLAMCATMVAAICVGWGADRARAEEPPVPDAIVPLALVLLTDVSYSVDANEYVLIKEGYRMAFADADVIATIEAAGGVAVTYVEFSDRNAVETVLDWRVLRGKADAVAFGLSIAAAPRTSAGNTALEAGLREATRKLTESPFPEARMVIDVASDLAWDGGRAAASRDEAVDAGVTINGLPIIEQTRVASIDGRLAFPDYQPPDGIVGFFAREVIGGNGAFLVEARDFHDFGDALRRKLLRELMIAKN